MNKGHLFIVLQVAFGIILISNLLFFALMTPTRRVCAVDAVGVGIYWDSDCTSEVTLIDWGDIPPDSVEKLTVYLRNEELTFPCYVYVWDENWLPEEAEHYLLFFAVTPGRIDVGETVAITLTLEVDRSVRGIDEFSFDIVFRATDHVLGDSLKE